MDTSKDSENRIGFPPYRRTHLRSHTYDTLVRILSHPSASSNPLHSPTRHLQIPDNGSGRMEQEKQQQEAECSEFVGSDFKDLKDPVPQKEMQEVNETIKWVEDLFWDKSLIPLNSRLDEKRSSGSEDDLMDYKVEHIEFQHDDVNNAMDSSSNPIGKGDIEEGENSGDFWMDGNSFDLNIFEDDDVNNAMYSSSNPIGKGDIEEGENSGDFWMDGNSFGMSSADSLILQQKNIDEVTEAMKLSFDLDLNIFEDDELLDYAILEYEHQMWNEEEKLKTLICANNATNASNNPIEEGEIEEGEIIGDFGMDGNSFDMSSEVKQKIDVSSKKKRGPGSEKQKARKKLKNQKKRAKKIRKERKATAYCRYYLNGRCHEGNKCNFSHDTELLTKSKPCRSFARGSCMRGDKCPFDHQLSKYSCTNFVSRGSCRRGDACMFSHQVPTEKDILILPNVSRPELKSPFMSRSINCSISPNRENGIKLPQLVNFGFPEQASSSLNKDDCSKVSDLQGGSSIHGATTDLQRSFTSHGDHNYSKSLQEGKKVV